LLSAARHNLRELPPSRSPSFDATQVNLNRVLVGPSRAAEVVEQARHLKLACHNAHHFKRFDHCQAIELLISVPACSAIDFMSYFETSLAWVRQRIGLPVLSAVVHRDEAHPHMHVLLSPACDGHYRGSEPINKRNLKRLRNAFGMEVAVPHGFRHLTHKMNPKAKQMAADKVLSYLEQLDLPSRHEIIWPLVKEQVRKNPVHIMQAIF
jgi:hypothetical protein